nr:unnamed protein product [Callosobruchus analis]
MGIIHPEHPNAQFFSENLLAIWLAIMQAVENHAEDGPQIRFQGCTVRTFLLLLDCADDTTAGWLGQNLSKLRPWENAKLRLLQWNELPKLHVCVVYIRNDVNTTALTWKQVQKRLRTMNRGLRTGASSLASSAPLSRPHPPIGSLPSSSSAGPSHSAGGSTEHPPRTSKTTPAMKRTSKGEPEISSDKGESNPTQSDKKAKARRGKDLLHPKKSIPNLPPLVPHHHLPPPPPGSTA